MCLFPVKRVDNYAELSQYPFEDIATLLQPYLLLFDRHCPLLTDQNIDNPVKRRDLRIAVTVFQFSEQVLGGLFCVLIFLKCLFFRKFFRLKSKRPPAEAEDARLISDRIHGFSGC